MRKICKLIQEIQNLCKITMDYFFILQLYSSPLFAASV